ncbi:wd repeat domain-containing protein [Cyclospora cayetanensis]|uniref:Wd repeat domain-containing protein n=1 Tax=Cyclospora cayetanensis TaxID=88456 RepID=A0A1D3D8D7_9EIME|nr:wd repeat domain-containing protein [Cyclospora cayetanensis]
MPKLVPPQSLLLQQLRHLRPRLLQMEEASSADCRTKRCACAVRSCCCCHKSHSDNGHDACLGADGVEASASMVALCAAAVGPPRSRVPPFGVRRSLLLSLRDIKRKSECLLSCPVIPSMAAASAAARRAAWWSLDAVSLAAGCPETGACVAAAVTSAVVGAGDADPWRRGLGAIPESLWFAAAARFQRVVNVWGHQQMPEEEMRLISLNPHQQHIVRDPAAVYVVRFVHSGSVLLTGGVDGLIKAWEPLPAKAFCTPVSPLAAEASTAAVEQECVCVGRPVVVQANDRDLRLYSLQQLLSSSAGNPGGLLSVEPLQRYPWGPAFFPHAIDTTKVGCGGPWGHLVALGLDEDSSAEESSDEDGGPSFSCVGPRRLRRRSSSMVVYPAYHDAFPDVCFANGSSDLATASDDGGASGLEFLLEGEARRLVCSIQGGLGSKRQQKKPTERGDGPLSSAYPSSSGESLSDASEGRANRATRLLHSNAYKVSPARRGGSRGTPQSPEFCVPLDCGVSVFCSTTGHRVGDALHGTLKRSVSLLRPHPATPDILLVASYGGDVCLLSLADAGALASSSREAVCDGRLPRSTAVNCSVLKRLRLGTQCCWLEGEWGPSGFAAALAHRFGCVSFFGCGEMPASAATLREQFLSTEFVSTTETPQGALIDSGSGLPLPLLPRGALLDAGGRSYPFHLQPPPPCVESLSIGEARRPQQQ